MITTTTIDGTTARVRPYGAIDHDTLPAVREAVTALPLQVTDVVWDMRDVPFMDAAGLHLLTDTPAGPRRHPARRTAAVERLTPQPLWLLHLAAALFPTAGFDRLLAEIPPYQAA
nr:STAS domain-containing protein [Streptomyces zinciresistens]